MRLVLLDTSKRGSSNEARRQREIVAYLAVESNAEARTRIAIAHALANRLNTRWQNIYSSVFRDIDEILIPLEILREEGRLPPRRGPKALQQEGVPYYTLTQGGMLVAVCLDQIDKARKIDVASRCIRSIEDRVLRDGLLALINLAPSLVIRFIKEYVDYYSTTNLTPLTIEKVRAALADSVNVELELLEALMNLNKEESERIINFLNILSE